MPVDVDLAADFVISRDWPSRRREITRRRRSRRMRAAELFMFFCFVFVREGG